MRVGEIVGLRWCDINFEENLISVNHTLVYYNKGDNNGCSYAVNTPKTKAGERTIPMLESVKEAFLKENHIRTKSEYLAVLKLMDIRILYLLIGLEMCRIKEH